MHHRRIARRTAPLLALAAAFTLPAAAVAATPPPLDQLVKHPMFESAKLSPDSTYLALTVPRGDQDALAILRVADLSLVKLHTLPERRSFAQFEWDGKERIIFSTLIKQGGYAAPFFTGDVYAFDIDGGNQRELFSEMLGYGRTTAGSKKSSVFEGASILDPLPEDPRKALIVVSTGGSRNGQPAEIYEIDTWSGRRKRLVKAPLPACGFQLDQQRFARFANCSDEHDTSLLYSRTPEDRDWALVNDSSKSGQRISVTHVAEDGRVFARADNRKDPARIGTFDPATGKFTELSRHAVVDPLFTLDTLDGSEPLAVGYMPGKAEVDFLPTDHPDAALLKSLLAAFPGQHVDIVGAGRDGRYAILVVQSDRDPGQFFLYDREQGQARFLMARRPWIDPAAMAEVRPFTLEARDGLALHGYLTVPPGRSLKNLPLIVNPHGGPHGPRDHWGYATDAQVLASRGYLVLQVNFRGSGGYGESFMEAGYREWGGRIQDDIIDATRWAIAQGYADPERVCTYGGSFGGYSAVMAPIREPGLFRCAVGIAGVYDLNLLFTDGDIQQRRAGNNFMDKVLGRDKALLDAHSPALHVDRLEAPVLIIHGKADVRAPISHAEALRRALDAKGHPYEWLVEAKEGHGFYGEENLVAMYQRVFAFLDRHMKPKSAVGELVPLSGD